MRKIKKQIDSLAKAIAKTIDRDLMWTFLSNEVFSKAQEMNGNKSIFDRRTKGGKYYQTKRLEFFNH